MPPRETVSRPELRDLAVYFRDLRDASKELQRLRRLYSEKRNDINRRLNAGAEIV
jgi:hypothetical protein